MPRHTRQEQMAIAERRMKVAQKFVRGATQREIAEVLGIGQSTVSLDLKAVKEDWRAANRESMDMHVAVECEMLNEVQRVAWAAWEESRKDAETLKAKVKDAGEGGRRSETEKITQGQVGDVRYLQVVIDCVEKRCKIRGIYQTDKHLHLHNNQLKVNWHELYKEMTEPDPIEERLAREEMIEGTVEAVDDRPQIEDADE